MTARCIGPLHLEDALRQIKPNGANLYDGWLLSCGVTNDGKRQALYAVQQGAVDAALCG